MAETKKKGRLFDLPETKGAFQLKGIVSGMEKDTAFKEIKTKSGKPMRMLNFGTSYLDGETLYVNLQGMEQENVYFSKRAEKKGEKAETVKVPWADRFSYNREGFRLIGKNIGVKKKVDSEGKTVNDKKVLTDFDACKEVKENLKDGSSVFIRGNLDYSSFTDDKGNKRTSTKLVPNQISLCSEIDFNDEKFEKQNDFNQVIILSRKRMIMINQLVDLLFLQRLLHIATLKMFSSLSRIRLLQRSLRIHLVLITQSR